MRTEFYSRNTPADSRNSSGIKPTNEKARNLSIISFTYSEKENKFLAHDVTKRRSTPCLCWSQRVATYLALTLTMLTRITHWTWTFRRWLEQNANTHSIQRACPRLQFQTWSRISQLRYQNSALFMCVCLNSVLYLWRSVCRKRAGSANFANTKARRLQVPSVTEVRNILVGPKHISMHCLFSC